MAMRNGPKILAAFSYGVVLLMLTSGAQPGNCEGSGSLFKKDVQGSVAEIGKKCSKDQTQTFGIYLNSFDSIGKKLIPYAMSLGSQPEWDESSGLSENIIETWLKSKAKELQTVFGIMGEATIVPLTCSLEREPAPCLNGVEQKGFSRIIFWELPFGKRTRHFVTVGGPSISSYGSTSLLGNSAGYNVYYSKAASVKDSFLELRVKRYILRKCFDTLVITCQFKKDGATFMLQMAWNVPTLLFKDQRSMIEYLKIMGPVCYAFDVDSDRTASFCR